MFRNLKEHEIPSCTAATRRPITQAAQHRPHTESMLHVRSIPKMLYWLAFLDKNTTHQRRLVIIIIVAILLPTRVSPRSVETISSRMS